MINFFFAVIGESDDMIVTPQIELVLEAIEKRAMKFTSFRGVIVGVRRTMGLTSVYSDETGVRQFLSSISERIVSVSDTFERCVDGDDTPF